MADIVLLHGAWHGGWCWRATAEMLRARGHRVTTPTQTGLGERRHLLSREITLETFARDLIEHLAYEDLSGAVLVGHSFGGNAISVAAERVPERVRRLVYLDSLVLGPGESPFSRLPDEVVESRRAAAMAHDGGLSIPCPPAESFGVVEPAQAEWLTRMMTPHPLGVFDSPIPLTGAPGAGFDPVYVVCTEPVYGPLVSSRERVRAAGWRVTELPAGHDAMVTAPEALADLVEREA